MKLSDLIDDLETVSIQYADRYGFDRSSDWFLLKLTEEVGELMQSYLRCNGQARTDGQDTETLRESLEDEIADVVSMALLFARNQGVDIENAIERKWLKYHKSPKSLASIAD